MKKRIFLLTMIFLTALNLYSSFDMDGFIWEVNYATFKESPPWYNIEGTWRHYRKIYFVQGLIFDKQDRLIGFARQINSNQFTLKIDSLEVKIFGIMTFIKNSIIICGTGELFDGTKVDRIKIILNRLYRIK